MGNLLNQESDGMNPTETGAVDPFNNSVMDDVPSAADLVNLLNADLQPDECPEGTETLTEEGNTKVEGLTKSVGQSGVTKRSFSCIKDKQGEVIELSAGIDASGVADSGDGFISSGKTTSFGTTKIDRSTVIVTLTLEGEATVSGATSFNGTLIFSGDTGTKGSVSIDCSNNQCKNGSVGPDLGGEGTTWLDGLSVSPLGTFIGSASTSGSRTFDNDGIMTLNGSASKSVPCDIRCVFFGRLLT